VMPWYPIAGAGTITFSRPGWNGAPPARANKKPGQPG
jgi:hypothetical protein